jgi:hypothetical protein
MIALTTPSVPAPTKPPQPRFGFSAALVIVVTHALLLRVLLDAALGSTPGVVAGLAIVIGAPLLNALFAWQLWRWVHHKFCGAASGAKVAPERHQQLRCAVFAVKAGTRLQHAHAPTSRPVVAPAGVPDAPFLARCNDTAAALAAELVAAADDAQRAAMLERLAEHYQLCWDLAAKRRSSHSAKLGLSVKLRRRAASDAEVPASFEARARELHGLAMRYPASAAPLAQGAFAWDVPPLRAGGEAAMAHALRSWTEATTEAADSALFSSMGLWISPFAARVYGFLAVLFVALSLLEVVNGLYKINPGLWTSHVGCVIDFTSVAVLLHTGRREPARWVSAVWSVLIGFTFVSESVLSSCKCVGPYAETHTTGGDPSLRDYPWQWTSSMAFATLVALTFAGLSTHPHRTFELWFVVFPCLLVAMLAPMAATDYQHFSGSSEIGVGPFALFSTYSAVALFAPVFTGIGAYFWAGRAHALVEAHHLAAEDAARYTRLWEQQLLPSAGFREALRSLEEGWREVQANALRLPKRQLGAPTLHALLTQADELNDLVQAKLHDVCVAHGGEPHACGIKTETRALQKVFRSYQGDWRRLGDLCRTSLVFSTIPQIEACLRAIGADAELQVLHAGNAKMRLREGFDAVTLSGGYRDIQLCVRLATAEARARGVHEHLAEVQLHYAPVIALKSDGGHQNYVLRRNLSGQ